MQLLYFFGEIYEIMYIFLSYQYINVGLITMSTNMNELILFASATGRFENCFQC